MKLSDGACAYVAEAAIAWDQARREAVLLRRERGALKCEHECDAEYDEMGRVTHPGDPACWNHVYQDQLGRDCRPPMDQWCEPCQKRQAVHEAYTAVSRRRAGLLRGLQRRALAAFESTQVPPQEAT